jgi:hypothetical protein
MPVKGALHRMAAYALDSHLSMVFWADKQKSAGKCRFLPVITSKYLPVSEKSYRSLQGSSYLRPPYVRA